MFHDAFYSFAVTYLVLVYTTSASEFKVSCFSEPCERDEACIHSFNGSCYCTNNFTDLSGNCTGSSDKVPVGKILVPVCFFGLIVLSFGIFMLYVHRKGQKPFTVKH